MWCWIQENAVDLIGHVLTLIGIVVGAMVVAWQLSRQQKGSLELQRNNAKEALKLDIYKTINERIRSLSHANIAAAMYAFMVPSKIENYQNLIASNIPVPPISERYMEFVLLHREADESVIKLIEEFEAWVIAFPALELFQTAINSASHDAREAFIALAPALSRSLPVDPPADSSLTISRPLSKPLLTTEQLKELRELVDRYWRSMNDIGSYIFDLRVEAQNNLLSGLFEHRAPQRKPLDSEMKVLSTEPEMIAKLMSYFLNETAWGRMKKRSEAEFVESQRKA